MTISFKKISAMVLLVITISVSLVGCGTGPDSGGMGSTSSSKVAN